MRTVRSRSIVSIGLVALVALAFVAGPAAAEKAPKPPKAPKVQTTYGKGVAKMDTVSIGRVLADPAEYLGKTVRVEGTVVGCCKMRGCWIDLASDKPYEKIQIKVNDGEIVFPMELMGERVLAQGVLEAVPLNHEQAVSYLQNEAACQKEKFDAATVPAEGVTIYRIHGTGAVVEPAEAPAPRSGGVDLSLDNPAMETLMQEPPAQVPERGATAKEQDSKGDRR